MNRAQKLRARTDKLNIDRMEMEVKEGQKIAESLIKHAESKPLLDAVSTGIGDEPRLVIEECCEYLGEAGFNVEYERGIVKITW